MCFRIFITFFPFPCLFQGHSTANLMTIAGNSASHGWGTAGKNGAQVELTADAQTLNGAITVDSISTLDFTLKNSSSFTGTINFNGHSITLADGTVLK